MPIAAEDEPIVEQYLADFHTALPPATPMNRDRARRDAIAAHAVATLALVRQIIAASTAPAAV